MPGVGYALGGMLCGNEYGVFGEEGILIAKPTVFLVYDWI